MAIINDYPGLTVEVVVDGYSLHEYDDDQEAPPKTTVKYIESQSGKEFAIRARCYPPFSNQYGLQMSTRIDGGKARTMWREPHRNHREWTDDHVSFTKDGQYYRAKYCFTALQIVEDNPSVHDIPTIHQEVQSKGQIEVSFRRLVNIRTIPSRKNKSRRSNNPPQGFSVMGDVPEKALKGDARSHQATLSDPMPVATRESSGVRQTYDYLDDEPFATFRFEYRSMTGLRALQLLDPKEKNDSEGQGYRIGAGQDGHIVRSFVKQEAISSAVSKRARAVVDVEDGDDDVVFVEARAVKRHRDEVIID